MKGRIIFFLLFSVLVFTAQITMHEVTHATITRTFGCEVTEWIFLEGNALVGMGQACPTVRAYELSNQAHAINEIVGYNVMVFIVLIFLTMVLKMVVVPR